MRHGYVRNLYPAGAVQIAYFQRTGLKPQGSATGTGKRHPLRGIGIVDADGVASGAAQAQHMGIAHMRDGPCFRIGQRPGDDRHIRITVFKRDQNLRTGQQGQGKAAVFADLQQGTAYPATAVAGASAGYVKRKIQLVTPEFIHICCVAGAAGNKGMQHAGDAAAPGGACRSKWAFRFLTGKAVAVIELFLSRLHRQPQLETQIGILSAFVANFSNQIFLVEGFAVMPRKAKDAAGPQQGDAAGAVKDAGATLQLLGAYPGKSFRLRGGFDMFICEIDIAEDRITTCRGCDCCCREKLWITSSKWSPSIPEMGVYCKRRSAPVLCTCGSSANMTVSLPSLSSK